MRTQSVLLSIPGTCTLYSLPQKMKESQTCIANECILNINNLVLCGRLVVSRHKARYIQRFEVPERIMEPSTSGCKGMF